jgi:hypothetical protein
MKNLDKLVQKKLEEILSEDGYVDRAKLEDCVRSCRTNGKSIAEALVNKGLLDEQKLVQIVADRMQMPYLSLQDCSFSTELIKKTPPYLMYKYQFIPVDQFEDVLTVLAAGVLTADMIQEIQNVTKTDVYIFVGKMSDVMNTLKQNVPFDESSLAGAESVHTAVFSQTEVSAGWESIFDMAEDSVKQDLTQKIGAESGGKENEFEDFMGSELQKSPTEPKPETEHVEALAAEKFEPQASPKVETQPAKKPEPGPAEVETQPAKKPEPSPKAEVVASKKSEAAQMPSYHTAEETQEIARDEAPLPDMSNVIPSLPGNKATGGQDGQRAELAKLAEHLAKNVFDYDAINQYIKLALELGDVKASVRQLTLFAWNLEQAGKNEESLDCYKYILELDPENREAKKRLKK